MDVSLVAFHYAYIDVEVLELEFYFKKSRCRFLSDHRHLDELLLLGEVGVTQLEAPISDCLRLRLGL